MTARYRAVLMLGFTITACTQICGPSSASSHPVTHAKHPAAPKQVNCYNRRGTEKRLLCLIDRACKRFKQDCNKAKQVAWCESTMGTDTTGTGHLGPWQYDWDTWNDPKNARYRKHSPHSLKWSTYATMHYWQIGETWRWSCY